MVWAYRLTDIDYFYGKKLALSLPKLHIASGKITALIGANGCGKSTLLNILALAKNNQHGQLCSSSYKISLLPQKPYMLRGSVRHNLAMALKFRNIAAAGDLIDKTLQQLNCSDLIAKPAKELSGGELQKVALARAIISAPDILLLDEPFNNLDYNSSQLLEDFMRDYTRQNKTIIFSTHNRLRGVAIADNFISLVDGYAVATPLINVFQGSCHKCLFDTGNIIVALAEGGENYQHISIDPNAITIAKLPAKDPGNQYRGTIVAMQQEADKIRITIAAAEVFYVLTNDKTLRDLSVSLGDNVYINFSSGAIVAF